MPLSPAGVSALLKAGFKDILVQSSAGEAAKFKVCFANQIAIHINICSPTLTFAPLSPVLSVLMDECDRQPKCAKLHSSAFVKVN